MKCWGITDGSAGMEAQVKALAAALWLTPEMKRVSIDPPWMPTFFYMICRGKFIRKNGIPALLTKDSDALNPPWPDLIISCGRKAAIIDLELQVYCKWAGELPPRFIHIGDPYVSSSHFDLVVAMEHDRIKGPNVVKTRFGLHQITTSALALASNAFSKRFSVFSKPHIAVLIGGSTNKYNLRTDGMRQIITALQRFLDHTPASLLITPSRRTGEENVNLLKQEFAKNHRVYLYGGQSENPYLGMLALADAIIVTNDSVNMMSEAHATGKPIYILPLPGHGGTKPVRFADMLMREGIARPLGDRLESWSYTVDNEMQALAQEIKKRLKLP